MTQKTNNLQSITPIPKDKTVLLLIIDTSNYELKHIEQVGGNDFANLIAKIYKDENRNKHIKLEKEKSLYDPVGTDSYNLPYTGLSKLIGAFEFFPNETIMQSLEDDSESLSFFGYKLIVQQ